MVSMTLRQLRISVFVIAWLLVFLYETFRYAYLSPLAGRPLPKLALLFPPAGWIMFYHVDSSYGFAEVYGFRHGQPFRIDPHEIFETRAVGYDNIHRNVLVTALYQEHAEAFCRYLRRKFPFYDSFTVMYGVYPDLIRLPTRVERRVAHQCQ